MLSSIAVAGWNNVLNMLPARDSAENASFAESDRAWLRGWLRWADEHKELLRQTRTILGQPALGKVDGTAAIDRDHGFIFLFNPDPRPLHARVVRNAMIGLTAGRAFMVREVHPQAGRRLAEPTHGFWRRGGVLEVMLDGASALVLEVIPAPAVVTQPLLFGASGSARINGSALVLDSVAGEAGTASRLIVALPDRSPLTRATVNGAPAAITWRSHGVAQLDVAFDGAAFSALQPVIPWTADDARTTWLMPERLLLWAPLSGANDSLSVTMTINGAPGTLQRAYTSVRVARGTFTGFYADMSALQPDRMYRVELTLPALARGQFLGLYVENVEPAYTRATSRPPR